MTFNFVKLKCIIVAVVLFLPNMPTQAAWAACSAGSKISGNQVLICATSSQQQTASSTSNSVSKTTPKATPKTNSPAQTVAPAPLNCPSSVTTTAQIVSATLLGCQIPGPSPKPPAPPKPTLSVKSKTVTSSTNSVLSDQALFSPEPISIQASSSTVQTGEALLFTTDAKDHERSALILGRLGYVRFVPVGFAWNPTPTQNSAIAVMAFASTGLKSITLEVTFQASSRFSLAEPWEAVGQVIATAETEVEVVRPDSPVVKDTVAKGKVKPRLVFASCETMPSTYRC